MKNTLRSLALLVACLAPALAQRDFLTPDEVSQVREAQQPDVRLTLYTTFAQLRMELLRNYFATEKPGRSALIHDTLEDYTKIIEAIDIVADDALRRNLAIDKGIDAVEKAERAMIADLERFDSMDAADSSRYRYALDDALEATRDSLALAEEDLRDRKADVAKRDKEEKTKLEEMMTPDDVKARREQEKKEGKDQPKRKLPSLRRPEDEVVAPTPAPKKK